MQVQVQVGRGGGGGDGTTSRWPGPGCCSLHRWSLRIAPLHVTSGCMLHVSLPLIRMEVLWKQRLLASPPFPWDAARACT